jgi:tetratricopeptide (TPR) repeat protein
MTLRTILPCFSCALLLGGCAGDAASPAHKSVPLDRVMAEADVAAKAGQQDQALVLLKGAAGTFPADKTPWVQMAQIKFDKGNYAEAIGNALEALQRDPQDKVANSIVAVSGLRLATRALADLSHQNNVSGSLRVEAQELAKTLRTSLGEEVLVPPAGGPRKATHKKPASVAAAAPAKSIGGKGAGDPFGNLK